MAEKTFALMGPGRGPRVPISGKTKLVVKGLASEEFVLAVVHFGQDGIVNACYEDGEHELQDGQFVSCSYDGTNRAMTCFVLSD